MDHIGASLDGFPQFGLYAGNYKESLTALDERNDFVGFKQRSFTSSDLLLAQADAQLPTIETIDSSKIIYMKECARRVLDRRLEPSRCESKCVSPFTSKLGQQPSVFGQG